MGTFATIKENLEEGGEKLKGLLKDAFVTKKKKKAKTFDKLKDNKALQAANKAADKRQRAESKKRATRKDQETTDIKLTKAEKATGGIAERVKKTFDYDSDERTKGSKYRKRREKSSKKNGYS